MLRGRYYEILQLSQTFRKYFGPESCFETSISINWQYSLMQKIDDPFKFINVRFYCSPTIDKNLISFGNHSGNSILVFGSEMALRVLKKKPISSRFPWSLRNCDVTVSSGFVLPTYKLSYLP